MLELMDSKLSHYSPFRKKNHAWVMCIFNQMEGTIFYTIFTYLFLSLIGCITGSCYHMFVLIWLVELLVPAITSLFFALIGWISGSCNFVGSNFLDWITGSRYYLLPYSDNVSLNLHNSRYSKFLVRSVWKRNVIGIIFSTVKPALVTTSIKQ